MVNIKYAMTVATWIIKRVQWQRYRFPYSKWFSPMNMKDLKN